jgi:hypothetical protein
MTHSRHLHARLSLTDGDRHMRLDDVPRDSRMEQPIIRNTSGITCVALTQHLPVFSYRPSARICAAPVCVCGVCLCVYIYLSIYLPTVCGVCLCVYIYLSIYLPIYLVDTTSLRKGIRFTCCMLYASQLHSHHFFYFFRWTPNLDNNTQLSATYHSLQHTPLHLPLLVTCVHT